MSECQPGSSETRRSSRRKRRQVLRDITLVKSPISGCAIDYRRPCSSGEGRLCHIFSDLDMWNEFFRPVGFALRELFPGELSFVNKTNVPLDREIEGSRRVAAALLWHLLSLHRCVVSVELNRTILRRQDELICGALRQTSSLKKLYIKGCAGNCIDMTTSYRLVALLPHLTQLQELQLRYLKFGYASSKRLAEYLTSTRTLRTLTMTEQYFKKDHGLIVLRGLERNVTIMTLSLRSDTVWVRVNNLLANHYASMRHFRAYVRAVSTLHTLSVTAACHFEETSWLFEAMFVRSTISQLNVTNFVLQIREIKLISTLLIENGTLKSLNFIKCSYIGTHDVADSCVEQTQNFGNVSRRIHPWIVALTENRTLEELTLSLSWYDVEDWRSFFKALASNASLKKINVCPRCPPTDAAEIFRAMRQTGVQGRFVGVLDVFDDAAFAKTEWSEVCSLRINSTTFHTYETLPGAAYSHFQSCTQLTSLCIVSEEEISNLTVSSLISHCLTDAMALRKLEVIAHVTFPRWYADRLIHKALVEGISTNNTLHSISIRGLSFDETEMQKLGDTLSLSRTLCQFCFFPRYYNPPLALLRPMAPVISGNYTLLDLQLKDCGDSSDFPTVVKVVSRNNSLVMRALHFVQGAHLKYCATALEKVHSTPGLVARVQSSASVDEKEAARIIRESLNSLLELDNFMRVAGVVKGSVTCHPRDDGKMQLSDLNRDSWLCIRKFLKVSDILPVE
ncbi:hypothetical protein MRX96_022101 [Rhipicephalus microplus]|uniref:Uncharacterized protein n=1 Tax=Rhipicephalus microplus TaxID=6941 RepID=A0A9J6ESD6_RHIMP|nr:hypothetical protein HPB51_008509 [Rhipicephalus microplus]